MVGVVGRVPLVLKKWSGRDATARDISKREQKRILLAVSSLTPYSAPKLHGCACVGHAGLNIWRLLRGKACAPHKEGGHEDFCFFAVRFKLTLTGV